MDVGLRTTGKPVDKPPNPKATAPRFYSTRIIHPNKIIEETNLSSTPPFAEH